MNLAEVLALAPIRPGAEEAELFPFVVVAPFAASVRLAGIVRWVLIRR